MNFSNYLVPNVAGAARIRRIEDATDDDSSSPPESQETDT